MEITVIGVDCAVSPANVGLARGRFSDGTLSVEQIVRGSSEPDLPGIIVQWLSVRPDAPALLALDAPLGWPKPLAQALTHHRAGDALEGEANELFRRTTDDCVWRRVGKRPLDVGADRIARTAHAALRLLNHLRQRPDSSIPLAWHPDITETAVIEVYPAATLMAHGIPAHAYKHARGAEDRSRILKELDRREDFTFESGLLDVPRTSDEVDAVVCLLAAQDFLLDKAEPPKNQPLAKKEGWIWVRTPSKGI